MIRIWSLDLWPQLVSTECDKITAATFDFSITCKRKKVQTYGWFRIKINSSRLPT